MRSSPWNSLGFVGIRDACQTEAYQRMDSSHHEDPTDDRHWLRVTSSTPCLHSKVKSYRNGLRDHPFTFRNPVRASNERLGARFF